MTNDELGRGVSVNTQAKIAVLQAQVNAEYLFGLAHEAQSRNCEPSAIGIREAGFRILIYADELQKIAEGPEKAVKD